jgi:hypothetical protein
MFVADAIRSGLWLTLRATVSSIARTVQGGTRGKD